MTHFDAKLRTDFPEATEPQVALYWKAADTRFVGDRCFTTVPASTFPHLPAVGDSTATIVVVGLLSPVNPDATNCTATVVDRVWLCEQANPCS